MSLLSSTLSAVPFVSNVDIVRLQMAGKQLSQSLTHLNCERPYVIGKDYRFLRLNQGDAVHDGDVVYSDSSIMVVHYMPDDGEKEYLKTYDISEYKHTKDGAASHLRFALDVGPVKKGDVLFEYDGFLGGIPSFGYNLNTAFLPFFSFTCEDAIVISETASQRCRQQKIETVFIPVYPYTSFKKIYPMSKYGFIPDVGQCIDGKIVFSQIFEKTVKPDQIAKSMAFYRHNEAETGNMVFKRYNVLTKYENAEVADIRIHPFKKAESFKIADNDILDTIKELTRDHNVRMAPIYQKLTEVFGAEYATELIKKHFFWNDLSALKDDLDFKNLQCMIEVRLVSDHNAEIGDKFANRYANKGTVSMILPDELRPYSAKTGTPINVLQNPLSILNRMNYGQAIEGAIAKAVEKAELECRDDISAVPEYVRKFSKLATLFGDDTYSDELVDLSNRLDTDPATLESFREDLEDGLYFEAPSFVAVDTVEMTKIINTEFDIDILEDIIIPVETFKYMRHKLGVDVIIPSEDVVMENVFITPMYFLKLKHLASDKLTARDFGKYTNGSAPTKVSGFDRASKVGGMEFDAMIASNTLKAMRELRSTKSDIASMKSDLVEQILTTGIYNMPEKTTDEGVKIVINNLIKMINN